MSRRTSCLRPVLAVSVMLAGLASASPAISAAAPPPKSAESSSLPSVPSGARPGPDVLYEPAPVAPQLQNRDPRFKAAPILVSGHEAYVGGEYLYQDWLYDDNGSDTGGNDPGSTDTAGDVTYPTDRGRYGGNAADLVELRIAPSRDSVAYRFTLNTLLAADATMVTLAFDTDGDPATGRSQLPRDPGFSVPGTDEVITTWGTGAEHSRLTTAQVTTRPVAVTTDLEADQITVTVPRTESDPAGRWTATLLVGLHDRVTGGWLRPTTTATAVSPGGAGPLDPVPSGVFNLGFRFNEQPKGTTPPDQGQAQAIQRKEPGSYRRAIDFGKLSSRAQSTTVPASGTMSRIFPSRLRLGEGKDYSASPELLGQLQPYSVYVPSTYRPGTPTPLTLYLHSLGEHHWQYNLSKGVQQVGEERGSIVITCECRGEDGWYQHEAEYDVFEMWNDAARRYSLAPDQVAVAGYSMGGYATYRLGTLYPDLFGKAFTTVGPPGEGIWVPPAPPTGGIETLTNVWLENARNLPYLNVAAAADELVPLAGPRAQNLGAPEVGVRGFEQLGYRYRYVVYPAAEHLTLAVLGYDMPYAAAFLGDAVVDRDPAHVTFSYVPAADDAGLGLVHDHAYWVSGIRVAAGAPEAPLAKGTVDVVSHGFGRGDPESTATTGAGTEPLPYTEVGRTWGPAPAIPIQNRLDMRLTGVATATFDLPRARIDPSRPVEVRVTATSEGTIRLAGRFPKGAVVTQDGAPVPDSSVDRTGATIPVQEGTATYLVSG